MDRIVALARRLGQAIGENEIHQALASARRALEADAPTRQLFADLSAQQAKIADLLRQQKPVEPPEKIRLNDLRQQLAGNAIAKALLKAEADFADLMNKVNAAIQEGIRRAQSPASDERSPDEQPT